jgi:hypothetical protein
MGHGTFQKGSDLVVDVPANQMGYFVIKYKTKQTNVASLYMPTTNTEVIDPNTGAYASGSVGYSTYPLWNWNGLDEWTVQVVDASHVLSDLADAEKVNHFLLRPAMDGEHTSANPVHISYIKFFATAEDAEAFADSEAVKTVEVPTGEATLEEGYSIGGKKFLSTSANPLIEMTAAEIETVGTWGSYGNSTTAVMADAIFLGTGESVDATDELPIENADPCYAAPIAGETKLGNGGYPSSVGGVIKVTSEHKYLRFWGWTGNPNPAVAFGYELAGEQFFDENFLIVDEGLQAAVPYHPNARRACITIPLDGLEKGKLYTVQLLVKHEGGSISTMSSGFHNFKIATEIEYDYQDAEGKLYTYDGAKMIGADGTVLQAAKFDDGKMYATDGYFYALQGVYSTTRQVTDYPMLEGVENIGGDCNLRAWTAPNIVSSNWLAWLDPSSMGTLLLGGGLSSGYYDRMIVQGTFSADSGITAVGYQIAGYDEVWFEDGKGPNSNGNFLGDDGVSYQIPTQFKNVEKNGSYEYQYLVKKDGQTYMMPGTYVYIMKIDDGVLLSYAWDAFKLRFADEPAIPEPPIGVNVNPYIFTAEDFADGSIDVTIPTGDRQHSWVKITGMKGKVLTIDNALASKFLNITDKAGNVYDFRKSPSYYGLALPILEDEYIVKVKTVDTSGSDRIYTFVEDPMLLAPEGVEGEGTDAAPYVLKYSNNYTVMAEGEATFRYTATAEGEVSIFATQGTLVITSSAGAEVVDGVVEVAAGDVITAVLTSADGIGYVYAGINFTAEVEHEHELKTVAGVPATCVTEGTTDAQVCSVCGITTKRHEVAPVVAHKYETVAGKDATCTETGLTEGKTCSVCGDVQTAQKEIAATGHTAGDWEIVTEAAIGVEGKKVKKCTVCAEVVEEEAIAALEAPATTAPTTDAPATEAPATSAPAATTEAKGGCGSMIASGAIVALAVMAGVSAAVVSKKKED